jgi:hypothetical protein
VPELWLDERVQLADPMTRAALEIGGLAHADTRREEARRVADQLLSDIELAGITPRDAVLRGSRLARLLDDTDAIEWLGYEIRGYPTTLTPEAAQAARRSARDVVGEDGQVRYWTQAVGALQAQTKSAMEQLGSISGTVSGDWAYRVELDRRAERATLNQAVVTNQQILDGVVGRLHEYASTKYQELRFGAAAETAFELLRTEVDQAIGETVPDALPMLSAAFENAGSDNPEHWAAAAATCRRLLKLVADALKPAGSDVHKDGRTIHMGDGNYVNRLIDWIASNTQSQTTAEVVTADLAFLGRRLDAVDGAGQKGAHASVSKLEASRFITGTYLVLGDILRLKVLHPEGATPL